MPQKTARKTTAKPKPKAKAPVKKQPAVQASQPPRTLTIVLATIAAFVVTILLYVAYIVFADYLDGSTISDGSALLVIVLFILGIVLGPGIIVAAIVWPKLRQK